MEAIENFIEEIPPHLALKLATTVVTHPMEVCKVLMQLGHEPVAPVQGKTWITGKPVLILPSVFTYMGHIRKKEGLSGLWRGCSPRLSMLLVQHYTAAKFDELYPPEAELTEEEEKKLDDQEKLLRFGRETVRCMANKMVCVVISHPLQVLTVRAIAEFLADEHKYTGDYVGGLIAGLINSIKDNGILSLWSGVQPRLAGELFVVWLSSVLAFAVNNYVLKKEEKSVKGYVEHAAGLICQSLAYPMQVVSTCMIVSRSGLAAGYPPFMPMYINWTDCYKHLKSQNQLKRGSGMLVRYYNGPQVLVGDKIVPVSSNMFKPPGKN